MAQPFRQLMLAISAIGGLAHVGFFVLFYVTGATEMAIINVASVLWYVLAALLTLRGRSPLALFAIEVVGHAIIAVHYVGWGSGFHYYIMTAPPVVMLSTASWRLKVPAAALIVVVYIVLGITKNTAVPVDVLPTAAIDVLHAINLTGASLIFMFLAATYARVVFQSEELLRTMSERLDRATRGANDGLWELNLATDQVWLSARCAEMLGHGSEERILDRSTVFNALHPDDLAAFRRAKDLSVAGGPPTDIEVRSQTHTGEWRWYRLRGAVQLDAAGRVTTLSGSQQDITERKQYQQALIEATEAAARANQAKGEFLANMSHEIRTPMNGVIGMTDLLLETKLDPIQNDYAQTVRYSASALLTVINDILDFSKIEAGKLDLEYLDMDMRDTLEDVARLLAVQAHKKGLELIALLDPALPDLVRGDAGRLRQVLLNLGSNAVKFTQSGEIVIACHVLEQDAQGTRVRCEVRDTGIGIPADRMNALFQAFTQVDASTTRRFGGTGLGLSIVKRLVELMGGEVGVESEPGVGSTFWFSARFPKAEKTGLFPTTPPIELRGLRALVVDDNATNRKVLTGQLSLCRMECVCASSADEALSLMRQAALIGQPFDVAILDYQMPGCDGAQLGKRIATEESLRSTRRVLLTSSGQRGDARQFGELGFAGYLLKPVTQRELTDCLVMVLSATAQDWNLRTQPIITRHALRSQRARELPRILLAEDNAVNQKVACRFLEKLGYGVDVAPDGQAAVDACASGRYGLILMDCQMPVLDGYEATRRIRAAEGSGRRIPIVALTAHAMKGIDQECINAGMDDYLSKPIDRDKLKACLDRWLKSTQHDAEGLSPVVANSG